MLFFERVLCTKNAPAQEVGRRENEKFVLKVSDLQKAQLKKDERIMSAAVLFERSVFATVNLMK